MAEQTPYDEMGGEAAVRAIIDDFIDRVFSDIMIGFHFRNANKKRIKETEFQLAAESLGADIKYKGKDLFEIHANHHIVGGHFMRRLKILENTLKDHQVAPHLIDIWLADNEGLRHEITGDKGGDCNHELAHARRRQMRKLKAD